jgi:sulfur-oxidizing protein SoxX
MRIASLMVGTLSAAALVLTLGVSEGFAKSKCTDGQTDAVASYKITKGKNIAKAINASLTGKPGDPKNGLKVMVHRRLGNCIACHTVSKIQALAKPDNLKSLKSYGFHGAIGPSLDGLTERYTEGEIRLIVVDPKQAFPDADTIMPAFQKNAGLSNVHKDCKGIAMLSPQQVEDVVAYLMTLK